MHLHSSPLLLSSGAVSIALFSGIRSSFLLLCCTWLAQQAHRERQREEPRVSYSSRALSHVAAQFVSCSSSDSLLQLTIEQNTIEQSTSAQQHTNTLCFSLFLPVLLLLSAASCKPSNHLHPDLATVVRSTITSNAHNSTAQFNCTMHHNWINERGRIF